MNWPHYFIIGGAISAGYLVLEHLPGRGGRHHPDALELAAIAVCGLLWPFALSTLICSMAIAWSAPRGSPPK